MCVVVEEINNVCHIERKATAQVSHRHIENTGKRPLWQHSLIKV